MPTNFQFIESQWPAIHDRLTRAEKMVITDPRGSLTYARMALELLVNWMYNNDPDLELPYDTSLNALMKNPGFRDQLSTKLYREIDLVRKVGNFAIHNRKVTEKDSEKIIYNLFYFAKWFVRAYSNEEQDVPSTFDFSHVPAEGEASLNRQQIQYLQKKFDAEIAEFQDELQKTLEENKELARENELYQQQLEDLKIRLNANKQEASHEDEVQHPRNEFETRKYFIDVLLREAGWELDGANDREYKVGYMPPSTNKTETGYVDYVLWNDDGKPLALVEAKRSMESATKGENQAQLYADSLERMFDQRPVIFYSNGFETYMWDDRFYKKARPVHGFYTKKELQTLLFRRSNRKDIRDAHIDLTITDRHYQMRAIRSITEHFAGTDPKTGQLLGTNRGALLVLATGTGKTRVAISLSKVMLESNWARRILFLADRTSLVSQAKREFAKHLPEHTGVNLLEDKENKDTRFVFSTYQTMMGLIDELKSGNQKFYGVGHFDLVIIDEAHRSIYQKYKAIFHYFDALLLGLTATPKDSIDRNTYGIFGLPDKTPTDAYTFDEAVENHHLVPYKSVEVPTKFHTRGIAYEELSPEEQAEFENEILDGQKASGKERVDKNALNAWLFNKDTATQTLEYVLKHGIRKRGGDEIGKTIIFARNQKHAHFLKDILLEMDKQQFGNDYVKVITHNEPKAEEFIRRFCDEEMERWPQIAISVDMLDTGIDVPSVVNLVFYKPVKSYTKFWQMIGRGSRPRPNLFGPGNDKQRFLIFDLCGNFEFFRENPRGIEAPAPKSLTETIFSLKLQLAQYLKEEHLQEKQEFQDFRKQLLDELHNDIASLDHDRFDVRMHIEQVLNYGGKNREVWNHLDNRDIHTIEQELAPLVKPPRGESDLARFYDRLLYTLMIKRAEIPETERFINAFSTPVSRVARLSQKLLKKSSIPEIKAREEVIKQPLDKDFWKKDGIKHLEKLRNGVRDLIKHIDREDQRYVTTDFKDQIYETDIKSHDFVADHGAAKKQNADPVATPFQNNLHRLREIIRNNSGNITIQRIRRGEKITKEELRSLEKLFFAGDLKKEELEKELGKELDLTEFIIQLVGLNKEHVDKAFARFINEYQLTSVQIEFLETLKKFITQNGQIELRKLYDPPFDKFHPHGIEGVFREDQTGKLIDIVKQFNEGQVGGS